MLETKKMFRALPNIKSKFIYIVYHAVALFAIHFSILILLAQFMTGRGVHKTADAIQQRMAVGAMEARRLVRTESTYIANSAELDSYKECGIDKYEFVATLDMRTSDVCAAMDGKKFDIDKAIPGTNMPPLHPRCRSTTIAVIDSAVTENLKRRAKDPKTGEYYEVSADMTYAEWKKGVDNGGNDGIIKISAPISSRKHPTGNPVGVAFGGNINKRQQSLLDRLPDVNSEITVSKRDVSMKDLAALTGYTGVEFSMFTKGNERLVVRGDSEHVYLLEERLKKLAKDGYHWSGHTHPGINNVVLYPSTDDRKILAWFTKQKYSSAYNGVGKSYTFGVKEDLVRDK